MAKKKEELSYLQMPLPSGQSTKRSVKVDWSGLNYRKKTDTGALSYEKNISTKEAPCLTPSGTFKEVYSFGEVPHEEIYDISEQGFCKVENGVLVYDDGEKRNVIGVPRAYSGTVIVPDDLTDNRYNKVDGFCNAAGATLFVVKAGYNYLDISPQYSDAEYEILFTSGITRINSCRSSNNSYASGYIDPKAIWIPKTIQYIAPDSIPPQGRVYYEGTEEEWKNVVFGYSRYWKYTGEVIYNSTGHSFDPNDYTNATPQTFTDSTIDGDAGNFTIVEYALKGYSGTSKRVKIPEGVVSISDEFAKTAGLIEEIQFPSTVKYFAAIGNYAKLRSISVYPSIGNTGTKVVGVGTKKAQRIVGDRAELAVLSYGAFGTYNIFSGYEYLSIIDATYERREIGHIDKSVKLSNLPNCTLLYFSNHEGKIASVEHESTRKRLLIHPMNYSWVPDYVKTIPYRCKNVEYNYKYPWAFIDDFTDKKYVYYVCVQNNGDQIPGTDEVKKSDTYYHPSGTSISVDFRDALGYWKYDDDAAQWAKISDISRSTTLIDFHDVYDSGCPELADAIVFQSRIFGVSEEKVFVSAFNEYAQWRLDTADSSSSSNAWITALNSNPAASGSITALIAYQDRVIVFRENYMYEIRGTKNPFRVVDIFQEGCIGKDAVCIAGGYLFFASRSGIKMYTGAKPKDISEPLGIDKIFYAAMGTDGRSLFVYCNTDKGANNLFVYDTTYGIWSEMEWDQKVLCFTNNDNGLYMLCEDNKIYHYEDREYSADWAAETDMSLGGTVDIKHLKKIQLYAEMSPGSRLSVILIHVNEDGSTTELPVCEERNLESGTNTIPIRVIPRKTASHGYKVRFEGSGYVKLYQMELTLSGGGELYGGQ